MRLSGSIEEFDALQALASRRRELPLTLETDRPLRKSRRMPKSVKQRLHREVLEQINSQLREQGRRAFRGHVAVDLDLQLPTGRYEAAMAPVVKGYLDTLVGSVYSDDAVIDHLTVTCSYAPGATTVKVRCQPISLFAATFDRSFRVASELRLHDPEAHPTSLPWGLKGFDHYEQESLRYEEGILAEINRLNFDEELAFEEDEDADFFPDVSDGNRELADPQLRESLGPELERNIGYSIGRQLTDQGFDSRDRPGTPPDWLREVLANDLGEVDYLPSTHAGCFTLPPPLEEERFDGEPSWDWLVRKGFTSRASSPWHWSRALFGEPLMLDIAIRGGAGPRHDLDNVARRVGEAFCTIYPAAGPLGGYRVYRVPRGSPEVRVRAIPVIRLKLLRRAWERAEELVLAERTERRRGLDKAVPL
ncbi:MAG TPA: hypothetical protein VFT79_04790 [Solirubrobacterales bacterium]|nr:hypothetical protein [Solirubrobacterales bacterium]